MSIRVVFGTTKNSIPHPTKGGWTQLSDEKTKRLLRESLVFRRGFFFFGSPGHEKSSWSDPVLVGFNVGKTQVSLVDGERFST